MLTCPCNVQPLHPTLNNKTGVYKGKYYFLTEAVLTNTHNLCFEQKYENSQNIPIENCHFYSREKSLYITWASFRKIYTIYNFISPSYMIHVKHRIQNIDACKKKSFGDNTDTHTKHTHTLLHT